MKAFEHLQLTGNTTLLYGLTVATTRVWILSAQCLGLGYSRFTAPESTMAQIS